MSALTTTVDLRRVLPYATHAAARLCRQHPLPWRDHEDVAHDLIVDLLARARHHDPARSSFSTFATLCFQHRVTRLEQVAQRERRHRHERSLDAPLPGTNGTILAGTLSNADGLGAWLGQDIDPVGQFERRHDLDRALGTVPPGMLRVCAALLQPGSDRTRPGLSRATLHRRVQDLRMRLLAAGIGGPRETNGGARE